MPASCLIFQPKENTVTNTAHAKDMYLQGRLLEAQARRDNTPATWEAFARIKASKGSYLLASMGCLNAANLYEAKGDAAAAMEAYTNGLEIAIKGKLKDAVLLLGARLAAWHERAEKFADAVAVYERMSIFFEAQQAWFLAADASEHAVEMMRAAGQDVSGYLRPHGLWLRNAEYWVGKDEGDEAWSRRRAELYLEDIKQ